MKKFLFNFLKFLIALAAIANLVMLFVFDYKLPDSIWQKVSFLPFGEHMMETEPATEQIPLEIIVPTSPITYNGSGALDLLEGVYLVNADGSRNNDITVSTAISAGNSRLDKVIEYSAVTEDGFTATASRKLNLGRQYIGPSITVIQDAEMPDLDEDTKANAYVKEMRKADIFQAQDGFGNDITSSVKGSIAPYGEDDETAEITLSVENKYGDSFSTEVSVPLGSSTGVVMKLKTKQVTVNVGDYFNFYDYIADCHDANGNELYYSISVNGYVDTYTPGEYTLEISCWDDYGVQSPIKKLTVTVK